MKKIELKELKVLQMDILSAVDKFCTENSIVYSMACGTLLGAIRHKGYIPWDDDIDIYMLREDYVNFMSSFPEVYEGKYKACSSERNKDWLLSYGKVYDINTRIEEPNSTYNIGVNIDVYPIDAVPSNYEDFLSFNKTRKLIYKALVARRYKFVFIFGKPLLTQLLVRVMSKKMWLRIFNRFITKYNGDNTGYVFECCQGLFQKRPFKKEVFSEIAQYQFEDRTFKAFKDFDEYLRNGYGDYMKLPPKEKQVSHHTFEAYYL